jgi:hypothetical protein
VQTGAIGVGRDGMGGVRQEGTEKRRNERAGSMQRLGGTGRVWRGDADGGVEAGKRARGLGLD